VRPFKGIFCDDISEFESYMHLDRDGHAELAAKVRAGKMSANAAARAIRTPPP
jgi:hypothetical protein